MNQAEEYIKLVQQRATLEKQSFIIVETDKGPQHMSLNTYLDCFQYTYKLIGHVLPDC